MKRVMLAAAIASLAVPRLAAAEEREDHPWSIGAGVGLSSFSSLQADPGIGPVWLSASPVTPVFTVERLVAPSTSIVLGVMAFGSTRNPSIAAGSISRGTVQVSGESNFDVGASLGVLRELTSDDAPVRFSVIGSVFAGYARQALDLRTVDATGVEQTATSYGRGFRGGVEGGIALDKPLLDRLTLRLTASLLSVDYAWSKSTAAAITGQAGNELSGFDARLSIEPSLELRFAF